MTEILIQFGVGALVGFATGMAIAFSIVRAVSRDG